jgi:hypothetical protein
MLTTEQPWTATAATTTKSLPTYELRLQVGTDEERLIAIPWGKNSVGSGPRCSLRLQYPGVQPIECLIVLDESGLRARRWSDNTTLNGESFDDARLAPGDVLTVGPAELEVVCPQPEVTETENPWAEITGWDSVATSTEYGDLECEDNQDVEVVAPAIEPGDAEHSFELSPQVLQPTEPNLGWEPSEAGDSELGEAAASLGENGDAGAESTPDPSSSARRGPSRRARAALRRQRKLYNQLLARFDDLERKIEQSLTETSSTEGQPEQVPNTPADASTALEQVRLQQEQESQLTEVREHLAIRDRELQQARYSIDVLERQLIDSQRTMHAFAEERITWESQFDELEARLADYVERIQELERQLDGVRASQTEAAPSVIAPSIEWATEPPADKSTSVDEVMAETVCDSADDTSVADIATWDDTVEEPAAEEVAPVEVTNVAAPDDTVVSADLVEESAEVDAALDHLKGLSIWREEPQIASESAVVEEPPVADEATSPATSSPPASFIDRYAHLFPSDDAPADSLAKPVEPVRHAPPLVHETAPAAVTAGSENEESVEQYMAKLLERMRGPANGDPAVEQKAPPAENSEDSNALADSLADEATASTHEPITDLAELKTKPAIVEQASHRQAMRELAMQSARHAIGIHALRKLRRSTRTRCIIALLGAAVAAYLLITAPNWKSLQFAGACVAGFVALYWGKLTLSTILEGIRLGAFDNYDDEIDADKTIHPPLPIDVEPATHSEPDTSAETVEHEEQEATAEPVGHVQQD